MSRKEGKIYLKFNPTEAKVTKMYHQMKIQNAEKGISSMLPFV